MAKAHLLATTVLILLLVSGCAQRDSPQTEGVGDQPGTGITFFGDARLGVTFKHPH